ncbi:unnamed protein product [Kuraishia capsulata CBS 1993]|uniref:AAA protein C-terminal winged helix domain-containing protein n=1 Tax=Kuraishia capsulata CBS 1993 TaxID=1382522 RepID=W6MFB0_9ASCO|nr:uncharacterized protein KUCA_T00000141001 [Kuraishia capsulata CBS 1993]CDK24181.1 unnamed protein product [Kuraishia capsulata CBS 1993]
MMAFKYKGVYLKIRPGLRQFHASSVTRINPLLPFDLTEDLDNDELKEKTRKLEKEKANKEEEARQRKEDEKKGYTGINRYKTPFEEEEKRRREKREEMWGRVRSVLMKILETGLITLSSLGVLAGGGIAYHKLYKYNVLDKISAAFDEGDRTFQLTKHKRARDDDEKQWVYRPQQDIFDDIVQGKIVGRYFLLVGEKGTGKTSTVLESIKKVNGKNCAIVDAISDPELFRIRIGTAIDFEFHEDYIGSLFSIRGPRDTTALLDIERAFHKLEEVAVRKVKQTGRPLVLVINNSHLIKDDEEGVKLVELLQQKAESLSGAGLVTMIFNSDDYWLYERMKRLGTRLEVINFNDLKRKDAINALKIARQRFFNETISEEMASQVFKLIGGRPQHISHVAGHEDVLKACNEIIDREKTWFLNQCGLLGEDMDDDVMESGKFSTSAMLLMRELVEMDRQRVANQKASEKANDGLEHGEHVLPEVPLWRARQIMTRSDYIQSYDNLNIFTIDSHSRVRADSVPMMRAFHEIASQPGFDDLLNETISRVADIESLGRTREVIAKDLMLGGHYRVEKKRNDDRQTSDVWLEGGSRRLFEETKQEDAVADESEPHLRLEEFSDGAHKRWWTKRLQHYGTYVSTGNDKSDDLTDRDQVLDLNRTSDDENDEA